ncbi:MAG TPA: hypothetical protein VFX95_00055, partial [Caulobacteraceae bacterium]|nr:hypothetical protein [Caulobacteraceae bacterium]
MVKSISMPMGRCVPARRALLVLGASLMAFQAAPAYSQTTPPDADEAVTVETVVVTAQRRVEENIDVPIALSVVGA